MKLADMPPPRPGWGWGTVEELGQLNEQPVLTGPFGTNLSRSDFQPTGVPLLTIGCLTSHGIDLSKAQHVSEAKADELARYRLRTGDLLFSRMASVGRAGFVTDELEGALFNYHIMRLRLDPEVCDPDLFLAYVRGAVTVRKYLEHVNHGATRDGINTKQLVEMPVSLPPRQEQRRIVAKIESLFERSRRAKEALGRIPPLLDKLRQSILAAAFRGDLTADWRAQNPSVEPADKLLERIRTERRDRWEQTELAKLRAKGKEPKDDKWKAKYKEPSHADSTFELPEGWCWASLDELIESLRNGVSKKPTADSSGVPILRISAVREMQVDLNDVRYLDGEASEFELFRLEAGDLLFTRYSGNPRYVGVCGLVHDGFQDGVYPDKLMRARPLSPLVSPDFLQTAMNAGAARDYISEKRKTAAGQVGISGSDLKLAPVALPPIAEQREIAKVVTRLWHAVTELAATQAQGSAQLTSLESSILAKAFRGELVEQDPNDEPASVLLERIRTAREAAIPVKKKKTKRRVGGKKNAEIEA